MEKDINVSSDVSIDIKITGGSASIAVASKSTGISNTTIVPLNALLKQLNVAVDAKWPGVKLVSDEAFTLLEAGVSSAG